MKTCSKCGVEKPLEDYSKEKRRKDGLCGTCRECKAAEHRAYRERNPDKRRDNHYRKIYGISLAEFNEMVAQQGGKCKIATCDGPAEHLDHNHTTGELRGILCNTCNVSLGMACDSPVKLRAQAQYLEEYGYYG